MVTLRLDELHADGYVIAEVECKPTDVSQQSEEVLACKMFSGVDEVVIDEGDVVDGLPQPEYSSAGEYSFVGDEVLLGVIFVLSFVDPTHE